MTKDMSRGPFMFVFGPNDSFFFDSPLTWKWHNISPKFRDILREYKQPYAVTLEEDVFLVMGEKKDGTVQFGKSRVADTLTT